MPSFEAGFRQAGSPRKAKEAKGMCEHCAVFKTWGEPIPEAGGEKCKRVANASEHLSTCGRPATWRVYVKRAEHHLCPIHVTIERRRWEELRRALGAFGVQEEVEFLLVDEPLACDHVDEEDIQTLCGRPASHVKMVTEVWPRCDEHAALVGFKQT
jgi:hypothetical protein